MADGAKTPSTNHMALVCVLECDGLLAKRGWEPGAPVVAILVSAGLPTRSGRFRYTTIDNSRLAR
ncbi:hypothetical protein T492DRAFT_857308 [Pavlovales sp. CCMP2436]|nr:hypothetical protein T492DRAFT_857308 [Pavlovales sp. CCMP2436]